jgi:nicotinamidase-related amidase
VNVPQRRIPDTAMTLPEDKTAILVMDCQNDIVDEHGKMAALSNGAMARMVKEKNVLGTIARPTAAGRDARVPIVYSAMPIDRTMPTCH